MADELPELRKVHVRGVDCYAIHSVPAGRLTSEHTDEVIRRAKAYPAQQKRIKELENRIFEEARKAIGRYDPNAPPLTKNRFANEFVEALAQKETP